MSNDILNVLAADLQIFTRIERCRILGEYGADAGGHAKTQVRVDVDLADCAASCFTKLIFRNADGILQSSAVLVDDLDIFLRYGGSSVQNDREARQSLDDFVKDVETKLRLCARLELVSTVAGSDCDRKGVNTGLADELFNIVRIGVGGILSGNLDIIFDAGQGSQLSLYDYAVSMCILNDLSGDLDILFKRLGGSIDHDRSETIVNAVLAGLEVRAVIQMQSNRKIRIQCQSTLYQLYKIYGIRICSCALGCLKDDRRIQLMSCLGDTLNDLHVVDVECADCVAAFVSLLKHLSGGN